MGEAINVRVNEGDAAKLRQIASEVGAVAPSGLAQGQPSISRLLMMIASGELEIYRVDHEQWPSTATSR